MSDNKDRVIALMQDLMFMVRLQETANSAGLETVVVKTRADAMTRAAEQPLLFVIDLNYEAGEPLELIRALKSSTASRNIHLLAFVSHVQVHLRAAATDAGCDTVLARSAFAQKLPEVITSLLISRSRPK